MRRNDRQRGNITNHSTIRDEEECMWRLHKIWQIRQKIAIFLDSPSWSRNCIEWTRKRRWQLINDYAIWEVKCLFNDQIYDVLIRTIEQKQKTFNQCLEAFQTKRFTIKTRDARKLSMKSLFPATFIFRFDFSISDKFRYILSAFRIIAIFIHVESEV